MVLLPTVVLKVLVHNVAGMAPLHLHLTRMHVPLGKVNRSTAHPHVAFSSCGFGWHAVCCLSCLLADPSVLNVRGLPGWLALTRGR